ncbi:MAG: glycosyltransferase, partial [Cyanobacteria bacterium P01_H01_bin.105]
MDSRQPDPIPIQHSWKHGLKLTSSDHYLQAASQYQRLGDNESAIKAYREALLYYPKLPEAYVNLGSIYEKLQHWHKARLAYQQGRSICSRSSENQLLFNQALARLDAQLKENKNEQTLSHLIYPFFQPETKLKKPVNRPKIAIIILNLNGASLLSELFQSIYTHNTYQEIELIIIDHGSSDQSQDICTAWSNSLPIRFFNRNQNFSFSNSNNFAVAKTDAPLLLFLNNDVVFCEDFLSKLVLLLQDESVGIAGVKFLQYQESKFSSKRKDVQHLGVHFSFQQEHQLFRPYEIQDTETFNTITSDCWQVPAISGALMLCRKIDFARVNGFHEGYYYGYEDVDLCLSFQKKLDKKVVSLNQTNIYHHQSYTRKKSEGFKQQRQDNYSNLENRFGYFLRRSYLTDFFDKPLFWTGKPMHLGFTVSSQDSCDGKNSFIKALGTHLSHRFGWHIDYISEKPSPQVITSLDIIVATSLEFNWHPILNTAKATLHKVFWLLQNSYESLTYKALWNYDSIWCSGEQSRLPLEKLLAKPTCLIPAEPQVNAIATSSQAILSTLSHKLKFTFRISIKISTPQWKNAHLWGDYHFALGLKRALDRQGHSARIDVLSEWNTRQSMGDDVVIVLRGLESYHPNPNQINILWNISHPETLELQELNAYDYIFVASIPYAETLSQTLQRKVEPLLQCTDPELFYRDLSQDFNVGQVIFVGNARKIYRPIVKHAIEAGIQIDVYGRGWEPFLPPGYVQQRHIPNHLLRHYYSRCGVLLNDHWETMGQNGFLSNRLFDAAACGATIISDHPVGLEAVFDEHIITYQDAADLPKLVNDCLQNRVKNSTTTSELA